MYSYAYPRPALTVDIVIFTLRDRHLHVLLVQRADDPFAGMWALPGGFVNIDESLEDAACRELDEETGLKPAYLEQLYTYGEPLRDPRGRTVTIAYFALTPGRRCDPQRGRQRRPASPLVPAGRAAQAGVRPFRHHRLCLAPLAL